MMEYTINIHYLNIVNQFQNLTLVTTGISITNLLILKPKISETLSNVVEVITKRLILEKVVILKSNN